MKTRVVVAMSGGVDSSVTAALLQEQGYEVIGITMCFGLKEANKKKPSCCGLQGIEDARRVAGKLGIKHYVLNFQAVLKEKVIDDFVKEYLAGRTPNPCVRCNQYVKFGHLLHKTRILGARYLATGHYARIVHSPQSTVHKETFLLKQAKDRNKDQSYFLYRLAQRQLKHILFPLGNYTKDDVRKLAKRFDLPVADKAGSQEICFIPDEDYRVFLRHTIEQMYNNRVDSYIKPGSILDKEGNVLGQHKGIPFYTIGQREGLGIARGYPVYITKIDPGNNSITLGKREDVLSYGLIVKELSFTPLQTTAPMKNSIRSVTGFTAEPIKREVVLKVKIRYNHREANCRVKPADGNRLIVVFREPQFAVAPGQSAVFYSGRNVIGGGIIEQSLSKEQIEREVRKKCRD